VTSRFRLVLLVGAIALAGCDEAHYAGPILYRDSERMAKDLADKPKLQATIRKSLASLFGDDLPHIKVPEDSGLRENGRFLANFERTGQKREPVLERDPKTGKMVPVEGGYALYRKNCLQCHGVFGAGDGPTSPFLYPRPRDYRPGIFKFTSTNPVNAKPSRADLRKTILYGLHGTSMPGFEAIMSATEIEQVIDYMTFLSMRGETEKWMIDEAMNADDNDAEAAISEDFVKEVVARVTSSWKEAETQVVNPSVRRVEATKESILRGRDLYLGNVASRTNKLECVKCHGASGRGNGESFIEAEIFRDVALRFWPLDQAIDRNYKITKEKEKEKVEGGSHGSTKANVKPEDGEKSSEAKPDKVKAEPGPEGVPKFLEANPNVVTQLRKNRGLMAETSDKDFAEKLKTDLPAVASQARILLPDLDDPKFRTFLVDKLELWSKSLDEWQNPLRPANLLEGTYKGGRRPIDLYWRIAKGINGVKMPAHAGQLSDDQIWDLVNFVLALPEDPTLLPESQPKPASSPDKAHAVATMR
jgi:mono/diheme cytochrome c family protein